MGKESIKLVANNKKAYHDYFIDDKLEAGIELFGTEVKSCLLYTSTRAALRRTSRMRRRCSVTW